MSENILYIKNMVCPRCIMVVGQILKQIEVKPSSVNLGMVWLQEELKPEKLVKLDELLHQHGFERVDDRKSKILEQVKTLIIDAIHHQEQLDLAINWSFYLSDKLNYEYNYLSSLFSGTESITLEQYIIRQKIEKVKEYLCYNELSIKEIACKLGYNSVAHLSSQFKKVIGFTPTAFKKTMQSDLPRKPLDNIM